MELGLSLGDSSRPFVGFMEKPNNPEASSSNRQLIGLGFNTTLSIGPIINSTRQRDQQEQEQEKEKEKEEAKANRVVNNPVLHQLDLLPQLSLPWPPSQNGSFSGELGGSSSKALDVKVLPLTTVAAAEDEAEEGAALSSSPNSAASSFQMDLCMFRGGGGGGGGGGSLSGSGGGNYYNSNYGGGKRDSDGEGYDHHQRDSSRASDEDDNGSGGTRKKLRLSKDQSAYLEESFKEHNTLNPKQKLALAKQLNLRPRQVEVWFQNRRARTKLKQTEVDCEYLKRCCETLTEENRRLHKELQELRALKTSNPFYMQLPATTLTMCPSCERVATNSTSTTTITSSSAATTNTAKSIIINDNDSITPKANIGLFPLGKPLFHPFAHTATTTPPQHTNLVAPSD